MHTGFWWGNQRERHHLEDPAVQGTIIFIWICRKYDEGMDGINLAQHRVRWPVLVTAVINLRIP